MMDGNVDLRRSDGSIEHDIMVFQKENTYQIKISRYQ